MRSPQAFDISEQVSERENRSPVTGSNHKLKALTLEAASPILLASDRMSWLMLTG